MSTPPPWHGAVLVKVGAMLGPAPGVEEQGLPRCARRSNGPRRGCALSDKWSCALPGGYAHVTQTVHSSKGPAGGSRVASGCPNRSRERQAAATSHGAVLAHDDVADRHQRGAGTGPGRLLGEVVLRRVPPAAHRHRLERPVLGADVGRPPRVDRRLPDRRRAQHDAAHAQGHRRRRPGVPARLAAADEAGCTAPSSTGRPRSDPGDITSYDTSQPAIFRADAPFDLLVLRLPKATLGKHAGKVSRLTAVTIPGEAGLPRLAARFFCEAANGLADGSIASGDTGLAEHVIDLVRRLYVDLDATAGAASAVDGRAPDSRPGLHRGAAGRSEPEPGGAGPRLLHLDPLPASGVRGRGTPGVRLHPLGAARSLPPRPARSGVRRPADLGDRQPLGAAERARISAGCSARPTGARRASSGATAGGWRPDPPTAASEDVPTVPPARWPLELGDPGPRGQGNLAGGA